MPYKWIGPDQGQPRFWQNHVIGPDQGRFGPDEGNSSVFALKTICGQSGQGVFSFRGGGQAPVRFDMLLRTTTLNVEILVRTKLQILSTHQNYYPPEFLPT